MGFLDLIVDHLDGALSAKDVPGGRSIFGPFEPFIPLFSPIAEGRDPTEDDLLDAAGSTAPAPGARETLQEGRKNVREYNDRKNDTIDRYMKRARKGVSEE